MNKATTPFSTPRRPAQQADRRVKGMPFMNNIIENVVAGVIVAAIIWLTTRLWTH
ncbi:hypothetical protein ABT143_34920 [Streptomyces sp. NPDC002033]|uniref:hypothetical protein n=1 Tax=unclassified Streptomyces TaxID=2593676 RepID=UPI0033246896